MSLSRTSFLFSAALACCAACSDDDKTQGAIKGGQSGRADSAAPSDPEDAGAPDAAGPPSDSEEAGPPSDAEDAGAPASIAKTILDLSDVSANPDGYEWFDFRPNIKKLILAGAAETEHIAILWYTVNDGGVALHYHSKTESVYVIDGTQTDAKGTYPTGTVYFNPPGSGHEVKDSSGFFLLAYAAPPDFANTDSIGEYQPVRIDTDAPDLVDSHPFAERQTAVRSFVPELDPAGGMSAELIETASPEAYAYEGNYLAVLEGSCAIDGETYGEDMLVVTDTVEPRGFTLAAADGDVCFALGVSF